MKAKGSLSRFKCTKCNAIEMVAGGSCDYKCAPCRTVNGVDPLKTSQYLAHKAVARSIAIGEMPKATSLICVDCGKQAEQYDHRDYGKPLEVAPVCRSCNCLRGASTDKIRDRVEAALARQKLPAKKAKKATEVQA